MKICESIKFYRIKRGFSQNDLAQKIGMSKQAVSMYERGEREPSIETLHRMCEVFKVDMDTLCGRLNEKTPPEEPKLSEGEEEILQLIRLMPAEMKAMYKEALRAALKTQGLI